MLNGFYELDRNSFKPLYVQLSEIILNRATDSQLNHGESIPSENELLSKFDVSRNTIRLAVERLVKLGVAKKIRGKGTFYIKDNRSLSVDYHHAFEGSAERIGLKVTNQLINKETVTGCINWIDGLGKTNWGETVWIRRKKMASNEFLAVEERLLPGFVVKRYSQKEIETENISPDLIEKYPDTETIRFNYIFISQPLTKEEANLLKLPEGMNCLRRIGEYYNAVDDRFMLSRLTIISDRINLRYEYAKQKDGWAFRA
jgi:DNA-binding GntR family transcriptional regulator